MADQAHLSHLLCVIWNVKANGLSAREKKKTGEKIKTQTNENRHLKHVRYESSSAIPCMVGIRLQLKER